MNSIDGWSADPAADPWTDGEFRGWELNSPDGKYKAFFSEFGGDGVRLDPGIVRWGPRDHSTKIGNARNAGEALNVFRAYFSNFYPL